MFSGFVEHIQHAGLVQNIDISMTIQRGRDVVGSGGTVVFDNHRIGGFLPFIERLGVLRPLRLNCRVRVNVKTIPEHGIMIHGVVVVFVGVVQPELQVPSIVGEHRRRDRRINGDVDDFHSVRLSGVESYSVTK